MDNMAFVALSIQSTSHFPYPFPFQQGNQAQKTLSVSLSLLNLTEIADKSKPFQSLELTVWSITYDGKRRGGGPAMGTTKGGESALSSDHGNKSPNSNDQEDIIALFRRIRSSISKGKQTGNAKTKSLSSSKDKSAPASASASASASDVLHESRKNVPGTRSKKGGKTLRWKRNVPKKTKSTGKKADAATPDFKLSRPPSNFVKRSPIPSPTPPRLMSIEQDIEVVTNDKGLNSADIELKEVAPFSKLSRPPSNFVKRSPIPYPTPPRLMLKPPSNFVKRSPIPYPTPPRLMNLEQEIELVINDEGSESAAIEKLKLPELKEVAKARGIKGYSRLKKRELVQLLSSKK